MISNNGHVKLSEKGLLTPDNCVVALIDHQPQMLFGVSSADRQTIINNTVALAKAEASVGVIPAEAAEVIARESRLDRIDFEHVRHETDIVGLLELNAATITALDIRYVGDRLLELCFTAEDRTQTVSQLQWLNDTLAQLHMSDRAYPLPPGG